MAHIEAAQQKLFGQKFTLGQLLSLSESYRIWLINYKTRQIGRERALIDQAELYRVPSCWLPFISEIDGAYDINELGGPVPYIQSSGYPFHSPNSARLAEMPGLMMEW